MFIGLTHTGQLKRLTQTVENIKHVTWPAYSPDLKDAGKACRAHLKDVLLSMFETERKAKFAGETGR